MRTSQQGLDLIKSFEGLRLSAYKCPADVWTIGYGTTYGVQPGQVITSERAEELLRDDVTKVEEQVLRTIKVPLKQGQFDALVSFTYNLGAGNLANSTLARLLNAGDYMGAAAQLDRWNKAGGKVLKGLVARRAAERAMFEAAS
ncbi:lysozyme [Ectopseudomonas composti]|uniref:lysozyme n=1 Tax=Ectopseudomonas composti TaxID=658457 RepID=UPI000773FB98|nr:lysozyme [Pseudomonas composti]